MYLISKCSITANFLLFHVIVEQECCKMSVSGLCCRHASSGENKSVALFTSLCEVRAPQLPWQHTLAGLALFEFYWFVSFDFSVMICKFSLLQTIVVRCCCKFLMCMCV